MALAALLSAPQGISEPGDPGAQEPSSRPRPQAVGAPRDQAVELVLDPGLTWDPEVSPPIHLLGAQSGLHRTTPRFDAESRTLSLPPGRPFLPGEVVRLTIARTPDFQGALLTFHVAAAKAPAEFTRAVLLAVGTSPNMISAADFDADGDPDLVASDVMGEDAIHVFRNEGSFIFTDLAPMPVPGIEDPSRFAVADLDLDGRLDLIVPGESSRHLAVLRGRGDGRFAATPALHLEAGTPVQAIAGDLDLDGQDEILIAHLGSTDRITVLAPDSTGSYGQERRVRVGRGIGALVLSDLDGDQDLDLAAASEEGDQLLLLHNQGDGRFELAGTLKTGDRPEAVLAGDLNGDRLPDLVTTNQGANDVSVFLARRKRDARTEIEYAEPMAYVTGDRPFIPALADLDGDGDLDLAVPGLLSDDVTVLLNQGSGTFALGARFQVDPGPVAVQAADFDGDGVLDLAVASSVADILTVYRNSHPVATGSEGVPGGPAGAGNTGTTPWRKELAQNVPNPFNPETEIPFRLERPGPVLLVVFNSSGKVVRTLVDEHRSAGLHLVTWDGTTDAGDKAPSGTYFYRLTTDETVELKRMTLLR